MSPNLIVDEALRNGYDIIGITDHNSTRQAEVVQQIGRKNGLFVLTGVEVSTKEEVHCLAFFESIEKLNQFQDYIDLHLPKIPNNEELFGYQVAVNEVDEIVYQEESSLLSALDVGINEVEKKVHELSGLFILAHIDRKSNGVLSVLGFLDPKLNVDALELRHADKEEIWNKYRIDTNIKCIKSSDAHYPEDITKEKTYFFLKTRSFMEIKMALSGIEGRSVEIE